MADCLRPRPIWCVGTDMHTISRQSSGSSGMRNGGANTLSLAEPSDGRDNSNLMSSSGMPALSLSHVLSI